MQWLAGTAMRGHERTVFLGPVMPASRNCHPPTETRWSEHDPNGTGIHGHSQSGNARDPRPLRKTRPQIKSRSDAMKERGLLPLRTAPPSVMMGSVHVPRERASRPLRKAYAGNQFVGIGVP